MRPALLALAPITLLAACGQSADPEAVLDTVRATEQSQFEALASGDLRGVVRNYEDQAVFVSHAGTESVGANAITGTYEALLADPNLQVEFTPGEAWAAASGDMAVTTYTAELTITDPVTGEPSTSSIGNQTVWRRVPGDPWKIISDLRFPIGDEEAA